MRRVLYVIPVVLTALMLAGPASAQMEGGAATMAETTAVDTALVDTTAVDSLAAVMEEPAAPVVETTSGGGFRTSGLVRFFNKGGRFMWALLALSILGLAVTIERGITLHKASTDVRKLMEGVVGALKKGKTDDALAICADTRGPIPQILHAGLLKAEKGKDAESIEKSIQTAGIIEMSFLERGLILLATVANVAPLLGFLGTVSGMISAFEAIAQAEQVSAKLVASGISEALITTMTGLVIAIPFQIAHNLYVQRIDRFVVEMEDSASEMLDTLHDMNLISK
jgi:biopolymer transport protein ExbB